MTVPLQDYDDRLKTMLLEAVPGAHDVSDWTVGSTNVDWWSLTTPKEFDVIATSNGYKSRTWRIGYEAFYALGAMDAGNKGPVRKKINELLPQIGAYFLTHANLRTDKPSQRKQIPGFMPGSFRTKYQGERVVNDKRGMLYTITFNHREQIQIKEQ